MKKKNKKAVELLLGKVFNLETDVSILKNEVNFLIEARIRDNTIILDSTEKKTPAEAIANRISGNYPIKHDPQSKPGD